jgi:hypothetical protein
LDKILYVVDRSDMPSKWGVNFSAHRTKVIF